MATHPLAVLLCCAAALPGLLAPPPLPELTCSEDGAEAAADLAVRHVDEHHKHGFRFRLREIQSSKYQQFPGGCHIDVNVKLTQTKCHFTDPEPLDRCQPWRRNERGAVATCSVEFWVMWGAAKITRHECATRPEHTNDELLTICPSCPKLLALDDPTGVSAVDAAVSKFNRDGRHQNYFTLLEVAQLTEGYVPAVGTVTWLKFALVETTCPRGATATFAACTPRCPDRANHVFCQTSYYNVHRQVGELSCQVYPPKFTFQVCFGDAGGKPHRNAASTSGSREARVGNSTARSAPDTKMSPPPNLKQELQHLLTAKWCS